MGPSQSNLLTNIATVVGICGPLLTAGKSVFLFAKDHSLDRKRRKTIEEISECLNRLHLLEASSSTRDLQLQPYRLQIASDLQVLLADLSTEREKTLLRDVRREQEQESLGIRTWLLLYRPDGLNGWLTQSFFFGTCAALVFILTKMFRERSIDLSEVFSTIVIMVIWLFYARSVSLRHKHIGIVTRRAGIDDPNSDLHWVRRALLLFKPTSVSAFIVHCFFYLFAFDAVALPVQEPISTLWNVMMRVGLLLTAKMFQVDALSRRALKMISDAPAAVARVG